MACHDWERLIAQAVDHALDDEERAAFEVHLAACAACRGSFLEQQAVARLLRAQAAARVPAGFAGRVAACVAERSGWLGLVEWRAWTIALVPVVVVLLLVAALVPAPGDTREASDPSVTTTSNQDPIALLIVSPAVSGEALLDLVLTGRADNGEGAAR